MASNSDLAGEESNATKSTTQAGLYQELKIILEILPIDNELQKALQSVFDELDKLSDADSEELRSSIVSFVSLLPSLKKNDLNVVVGVQLFQNASSIFKQLSTVHPVFSVLYFVIVAGMALFNRQTNSPNLETTLKEMLKEQSDSDMLNECEGIKCTLTKYAKLVCAMGDKKLETHEVSAVCAMVPIGDGFATMGKLAKRIKELRDEEYEKYCSYRTSEFEKIVRYIHVYCCLDTMKRGILWHIYALLKFSNNSPSLIKGVKAVIEEQQDENRELLKFLVQPSRETAIIHYSGNLFEHKIIQQFLEAHEMKMDDLNFLCEGVYHIKPVMYKDSKMYMAKNKFPGLKFVRWTYTKSVAQKKNRFTFQRASIGGNYFHINSHRHTEYHVRAVINGMWVDGLSGDPSAVYGTWKIIPIDSGGKSKYYLIAPQGFTNMFLFAGFTGRICVQKFIKSEYEQVLWQIEQTVDEDNSDNTALEAENDENKKNEDEDNSDNTALEAENDENKQNEDDKNDGNKQADDHGNDDKQADDKKKKGNKQTDDYQKNDHKQADYRENDDNKQADDQENDDNKQAGNHENDDNKQAGNHENDDNKQAGNQENDDNKQADDQENDDNKQAGNHENDDNKQAGNQENDDKKQAGNHENDDNKQAGNQENDDNKADDQENDDNKQAGNHENDDNKQAGNQENDDKKQAGNHENDDNKQAGNHENDDNKQAGNQENDDKKQAGNQENDDKQADDQENDDNKQADDQENEDNKQADDQENDDNTSN
ncbi:uncharacterized protein LOC127701015 isoform X2 [Mytilus californianus]|uniref:uncharacterized protein LOC127701015 isoform X2 n=1 Tax=Mytilus californianus TaxID=6549 RepID=UPI002247E844|nr:uncharacterized protein LOC127701015 isoform X2 [Mytilus californianus]